MRWRRADPTAPTARTAGIRNRPPPRRTHANLTASPAALRAWYGSRHQHPERLDLAIVERPSPERPTSDYAGEIVLNELDRPNHSCCLRIALRRGYRDRGLGSEAVRLVLAHAFGTVGLHRIELDVYAFNPRAQAVYERAGFVREGVRRDALYWDGEYTDAITMAILAPDWRAAGNGGQYGGDPR